MELLAESKKHGNKRVLIDEDGETAFLNHI